jgi:hypothetical protein
MKKKYVLKPGRHQFAPGSHAEHANDNLTDAEAEWYLQRYPHITKLFVGSPEVGKTESPEVPEVIQEEKTIAPNDARSSPEIAFPLSIIQ